MKPDQTRKLVTLTKLKKDADLENLPISRSTMYRLRRNGVLRKGFHWFGGGHSTVQVLYDLNQTKEALISHYSMVY